MPHVYEAYKSPDFQVATKGVGGSASVTYVVLEATTLADAYALVKALAPLTVLADLETLVRVRIKISPTGIDSWEGVVEYVSEDKAQSQEPPQPGTWKFSFDTTGGRQKITKALSQISRHWYATDDEAPDLKGAINDDGQRVEGTEIVVPNLQFTITAYYDAADVTTTLMRDLSRKTPRVNSDTWLGFSAGEVLYVGSQGQGDIPTVAGQRVQPIALNHTFWASENRTNVDSSFGYGSPQASINKKGWEYLWYRFKYIKSSGQVVAQARHAYVDKVYDDSLAFRTFFGFG